MYRSLRETFRTTSKYRSALVSYGRTASRLWYEKGWVEIDTFDDDICRGQEGMKRLQEQDYRHVYTSGLALTAEGRERAAELLAVATGRKCQHEGVAV